MAPRRSVDARIVWSLVAAGVCYAVGYPLALIGHSNVGWVLVFLGGPLLLTAGVLTVRWLHRDADPMRVPTGREPGSRPLD